MVGNWPLVKRRQALQARADIIQHIRQFFLAGGYLEVETPLLIPAPAPESHIDALPCGNLFLHTSPELCMKRLLAAGYDRIFQICHCWRAEERGTRHLPEFTMLEWYRAGADYLSLMDECESLGRFIATGFHGKGEIEYRGQLVQLNDKWERVSVREAFSRFANISMEEALERDLFDEVMCQEIEPSLGIGQPTFIYDYPIARGALARPKQTDSTVAERFELYIGGLELANAFSELIDPVEQNRRFEEERNFRVRQNKTVYPLPDKFLAELAQMPPAAGIALGIDRLIMVMLDAESIDEIVAFTPEEL